jgi:hypothetical protein
MTMTTSKKIDSKRAIKLVTVNLDTLAEVDACSYVGEILEIAALSRQICDCHSPYSNAGCLFTEVNEILADTTKKLKQVKVKWEAGEEHARHEAERRKQRRS